MTETPKPKYPVAMIAAVARNGVIGRDGDLPWRLATDLKYFKAMTLGKPIIMGRKQYASVGKPLPGRENIILTRDSGFVAPGCTVVSNLDAALKVAEKACDATGASEIMIIGGGEIYRLALPLAARLYLTEVALDPRGDVHFPPIDRAAWREVSRVPLERGPKDEADAVYVVLERRT
jgi:dihydrofolate reductase